MFVLASSFQNKCGIFRNNEAILNVAPWTPLVSHSVLIHKAGALLLPAPDEGLKVKMDYLFLSCYRNAARSSFVIWM